MERFSPSRGFILDLGGWGLAVPFYSDQDCSFLSNSYMTLGAQSCAVRSWEDACIRPACNKWSPTRALIRVACSRRSDSGERCEVKRSSPLSERLEKAIIRGELSQVLPEPHLHSTVHLKYFFGAFAIPPSAANSGTAGKWNKFIKSEIPNREVGRGKSFPLMLLSSYQEPSCSYSFISLLISRSHDSEFLFE